MTVSDLSLQSKDEQVQDQPYNHIGLKQTLI